MKRTTIITIFGFFAACDSEPASSSDCATYVWRAGRELPACITPQGVVGDLACFRTPEEATDWVKRANVRMCRLYELIGEGPYMGTLSYGGHTYQFETLDGGHVTPWR